MKKKAPMIGHRGRVRCWLALLALAGSLGGQVLSEQKISATSGGFTGTLLSGTQFGRSITALRDFDGDGIDDIATEACSADPSVEAPFGCSI